ncbi:serine hydrolase domain-containing protein [Kitasatospora misakiensis]|uniref:Serine hydrolase domain-containing protein n=1 Tax=Kitasatospora misakiensis TaxID=67330 RepID=A0ABW0X6I9_9ACTN
MNSPTPQPFRTLRRKAVAAAVAVTVGALAAGVLAVPSAVAASGRDVVQQRMNALVADGVAPGVLGSVRSLDGRTRGYTAGVGDVATGAAVPRDGQVRVGSNTKTFTAVLVLQLVARGKVDLDASVETYLPGVVHGDRIDGNRITVRHLLQQTSGLPNYTLHLGDDVRLYQPRELVDIALRYPGESEPGKVWAYSNTNYVLAGLIVEAVTHRTLAEEIDRRIVRPLGLRHTYFPAPGDATIREAHPRGYYRESAGTPLVDVTETDPSWAWAAGQLVSTPADLNRFFTGLLNGALLPPEQLAEMRATIPAGEPFVAGTRYGLGLVSTPLSCGGVYWGHGGSIPGYETRVGVTEDGRAATVTMNVQAPDKAVARQLEGVVDAALCR